MNFQEKLFIFHVFWMTLHNWGVPALHWYLQNGKSYEIMKGSCSKEMDEPLVQLLLCKETPQGRPQRRCKVWQQSVLVCCWVQIIQTYFGQVTLFAKYYSLPIPVVQQNLVELCGVIYCGVWRHHNVEGNNIWLQRKSGLVTCHFNAER